MNRSVTISLGKLDSESYTRDAAYAFLNGVARRTLSMDDLGNPIGAFHDQLELEIARTMSTKLYDDYWLKESNEYCLSLEKRRMYMAVEYSGMYYFGKAEW